MGLKWKIIILRAEFDYWKLLCVVDIFVDFLFRTTVNQDSIETRTGLKRKNGGGVKIESRWERSMGISVGWWSRLWYTTDSDKSKKWMAHHSNYVLVFFSWFLRSDFLDWNCIHFSWCYKFYHFQWFHFLLSLANKSLKLILWVCFHWIHVFFPRPKQKDLFD